MSAPNTIKQTPARVLLAFAITAVLVAVFTAVQAGRRPQLEGLDFPSALGDSEHFAFADVFDPDVPVMRFDGRPIFRLRRKALDRFDKYMVKVGRDDEDRCYLYHYEVPRRGIRTPDGHYWIKVGEGSYVEVGVEPRPETGEAREPSGADGGRGA